MILINSFHPVRLFIFYFNLKCCFRNNFQSCFSFHCLEFPRRYRRVLPKKNPKTKRLKRIGLIIDVGAGQSVGHPQHNTMTEGEKKAVAINVLQVVTQVSTH